MDKFSPLSDLKGKNVAILGFGIEGESIVKYLLKQGSRLSVFDEKESKNFDKNTILYFQNKGIDFHFGSFPKDFSGYDILVRSPGVRFDMPQIQKALKEGAIVTSSTKIFFDLCPAKIIGVTGTKGKGTTSSLIYEMLKLHGFDAYLGGNIGIPALDFLDNLKSDSWVVLELSSFQLLDLHKSPHIAVILMVTSEHLDYHKDALEYVEAKRNILRFQDYSDFAIVNRDYPASNECDICTNAKVYQVSREQGVLEGCFVEDGEIRSKIKNQKSKIINIKDILLPGKHNLENICAAVMAAYLAGVSKANIAKVLKTFKGLEHRLELVETVNGVRYYDDSFSTTPETAIAAIEAFSDPEILILGGSSKGSDFTSLGKVIDNSKNIKAIIGIGIEWERMKSQFPISNFQFPIFENCKNMQEIVQKASEIAGFGNVVLLSPACASFDMFKNYKDRGEQFKKEVLKLKDLSVSEIEIKS